MSETLHRLLMFAGATVTGIAGLLVAANLADPQVTGWIIVAGSSATLAGNQIRVWWGTKPGAAP